MNESQSMVRSLVAGVLLVGLGSGCRTVQVSNAQAVGAGTPTDAVEMMLAAAQRQDLQAMSAVWGDEQGMTRDRIDRAELESRTLIMACLLRHDSQQVGEPKLATGGRYLINVDLIQKANSATSTFTVAKSAAGRWLVTAIDLAALQNKGFCPRSGH